MKNNRKLSNYRRGYIQALMDLAKIASAVFAFVIYTLMSYRFFEKLFM